MDGLFHKVTEWLVHQIWIDKNNRKTASIFQIMRKYCVLIRYLVNIVTGRPGSFIHPGTEKVVR